MEGKAREGLVRARVYSTVCLSSCSQEKQSLPGDREPAVKRAFKSFVEERDDKFTMELLLLPSALKEELLGLAHSSSINPVSTASLFSLPAREVPRRLQKLLTMAARRACSSY